MPKIDEIINDLKDFLKDADGWNRISIPIGNNSQVVCLPENKKRGKALALVRNPNKKKNGQFYTNMEQYLTEVDDINNNSENYLLVLKAIESINGKTPEPKKEMKFDWF